MKLSTFFLLTHGATATVAAGTAAVCQTTDPLKLSLVVALTAVAGGVAAWRASRSIGSSLAHLEAVAADHEKSASVRTGLAEFDRAVQSLGKSAQRWETAAATTRRQKRELQAMIGLLGGSATREPTSGQLRELLAELGSLLHRQQCTIERATADIEPCGEAITKATNSQRRALDEAASCTKQLNTAINALDQQISSATATGQRSGELAAAALAQLRDVITSFENAPTELQCEQQTADPSDGRSRNSGELAVRLEVLSERAHLLVLNASLQSLHTGERAARSSYIADEAGALAVELQAAANGMAGLLGATMRVPAEMPGGKQQDERTTTASGRSVEIIHVLTSLCQALDEHALCIHQLSELSRHQRQLSRQLRSALEQCSAATQTRYDAATRQRDVLLALATQTPLIDHQIDRLRSCGPGAACVADTPASEISASAPTGFSVAPSEPHPLLAGGTA